MSPKQINSLDQCEDSASVKLNLTEAIDSLEKAMVCMYQVQQRVENIVEHIAGNIPQPGSTPSNPRPLSIALIDRIRSYTEDLMNWSDFMNADLNRL